MMLLKALGLAVVTIGVLTGLVTALILGLKYHPAVVGWVFVVLFIAFIVAGTTAVFYQMLEGDTE